MVSGSFSQQPVLALMVTLGLLLALGALLLRIGPVAFGDVRGAAGPRQGSMVPAFAHMALVLMGGVYLPGPLVALFQHVADLLG